MSTYGRCCLNRSSRRMRIWKALVHAPLRKLSEPDRKLSLTVTVCSIFDLSQFVKYSISILLAIMYQLYLKTCKYFVFHDAFMNEVN